MDNWNKLTDTIAQGWTFTFYLFVLAFFGLLGAAIVLPLAEINGEPATPVQYVVSETLPESIAVPANVVLRLPAEYLQTLPTTTVALTSTNIVNEQTPEPTIVPPTPTATPTLPPLVGTIAPETFAAAASASESDNSEDTDSPAEPAPAVVAPQSIFYGGPCSYGVCILRQYSQNDPWTFWVDENHSREYFYASGGWDSLGDALAGGTVGSGNQTQGITSILICPRNPALEPRLEALSEFYGNLSGFSFLPKKFDGNGAPGVEYDGVVQPTNRVVPFLNGDNPGTFGYTSQDLCSKN